MFRNVSRPMPNCLGPSIKYVTLFWPIFTPLPLSHFVTHPGTPRKYVTLTHPEPPSGFLEGLVKKPGQKPACTNSVSIVRRGFVRGFCQRVFCLEGFVRGGFCPFLFCQNTSVTSES